MKLIIKKLVLQSLVEKTASIVQGSAKEVAPVLKNFMLEATAGAKGKVRMVATDTDLTDISETELVSVEEVGSALIPAKMLLDIVRGCEDVDIALETTDDKALIKAGGATWDVKLMKEKYPPIPVIADVMWQQVAADPLVKALKKVRSAASKDASKPEQTLIKLGATGVFATDGTRLHHATVNVPIELELQAGASDELVKIMRYSMDESIQVAQTASHILFKISNDIFLATKLNVKFPPVQIILDSVKDNSLELQVSRKELLDAVARVRITADTETNRITFSLRQHKLFVETKDKNNNSCVEELSVHWANPDLVVHLNWINLKDAIDDMESPNVFIRFGQNKGVRLAPVSVREENFVAIMNQLRTVSGVAATGPKS